MSTNKPIHHLVAIAVLVALFSIIPAKAHYQGKIDPNDASGPLDIHASALTHKSGTLFVAIRTYSRWPASLLGKPRNAIYLDFDSRGGAGEDYDVHVYYANGRLIAKLWRWVSADKAVFVQRVHVTKKGAAALLVSFKKSALRPRRSYIGWGVQTDYRGSRDFAPKPGKWYKHGF